MRVLKRSLQTALILVAVGIPVAAHAQDRVGITLGVGPITSMETAPANGYVEPFFVISVQRVVKRYFVIEGELAHWANTLRIERGPHDVSGPQGVIGRVGGTTTIDSHSLWNVGANVLVRSTGRVRVYGGGGASLSTDNTEHSQESFDCSPSLDPRICQRFVSARSRGPLPLFRVLGGIEVPLAKRVGIYASVRRDVINWEDRSTFIGAIAGVRFSFE